MYNKRQKNQKFFSFNFFLKNQKAQIGETITWVVATLIIIVILAFSIFISSFYLGGGKSVSFSERSDLLASKSLFSYLLTPAGDEKIYDQLKEEENLNEFNGNLALNIFETLYEDDYEDVWLGIVFNKVLFPAKSNDYFGRRPTGVRGGDFNIGRRFVPSISEKIKLNENKSLELYLGKESSIK